MFERVDPFTFEIIRHKLFRVIDEGLITLANVSGTTVTAEGHDVLVALYLPDGTLLLAGVGFLHHILPASRAVKQIIESFGEDPGIFEGDVFLANDPYTVAMHCPDIFMITPIYASDRIASWVVNFVHVTDIGGVDPGGFCPNATEVYQEGFSTKGLKIVEQGHLRRDVYETFLNMIRDPEMTGLDLKSQISSNHVVQERMRHIYEDYGLDSVDAVATELISQSEQRLRRRLRNLPDGQWRARRYLDMPHKTYRIELTAEKEGDELVYDFTGTDSQTDFPINCQYWATKGAALAPILPLLAWDLTWNEGIVRCLEVIAPEGSLLNAQRPAPISLNTISSVHAVNILSNAVISKMLAASPIYKERAMGCWMGTNIAWVGAAFNRFGEYVAQLAGDGFGMPEGARSYRDGAGSGGHIVNIAQKMPNVESEEQVFPKLFLYRRVVPDSGGAGKYRGGPAHEHAVLLHGSAGETMTAVINTTGANFPGASGLSGGYPGATAAHRVFRHSNGGDLPQDLDATAKDRAEEVHARAVSMSSDDILYLRPDGGGGYGDPLDRDPTLVLQDVQEEIVTLQAASRVFGVVFDDEEKVDLDATRRQRLSLRADRLGGRPKIDVSERGDIERTPFRINEYLQVGEKGQWIDCTWCGETICAVQELWKDHTVVRKVPVMLAGPPSRRSEEYYLRQYFCPSCGTSLEVEVDLQDEPPLHDRIYKWPT